MLLRDVRGDSVAARHRFRLLMRQAMSSTPLLSALFRLAKPRDIPAHLPEAALLQRAMSVLAFS